MPRAASFFMLLFIYVYDSYVYIAAMTHCRRSHHHWLLFNATPYQLRYLFFVAADALLFFQSCRVAVFRVRHDDLLRRFRAAIMPPLSPLRHAMMIDAAADTLSCYLMLITMMLPAMPHYADGLFAADATLLYADAYFCCRHFHSPMPLLLRHYADAIHC